MKVETEIRQTLIGALSPMHLEIINESGMHSVPPGSESHFKIVAVADCFTDKPLVQRHRMINELLAQQIAGPVHALALHTLTPSEWQAADAPIASSPKCLGGSKLEQTG